MINIHINSICDPFQLWYYTYCIMFKNAGKHGASCFFFFAFFVINRADVVLFLEIIRIFQAFLLVRFWLQRYFYISDYYCCNSYFISSTQSFMSVSTFDLNAHAATRDYNITPRIDYRTVVKVDGPLVILDNVKFPKFA